MLKAAGDFVIIEPIIQEKIGIIFLPDQAKKEVSNSFGTVISVGPENKDGLKAGDKVFFRKNEGTVIEEKYLSLAPKWILGVVS
jgi:co-chaperonin GroES (HSP10)